MGNCFNCFRSEEDRSNDGAPKCEQLSSVILAQEKNNSAQKDVEGETTSKAGHKCQPKTELQKSTSGMQNVESQETAKVFKNNLDKEKVLQDNLDAKGESLEEPVQTEVKENFSSEETEEVDVADVVAEPEIDDGAEKMNLPKEDDFEVKSQNEKRHLSAGTNIVGGESGFDVEMEDQPQEIGLATGAEKMSQLNEEDFEIKSESEIPFEKGLIPFEKGLKGDPISFPETNIVGESVFDIEVEDEPQETKLATSSNVHNSSRGEFKNKDVLLDAEIVIAVTVETSITDMDKEVSADENNRIEENVGETTFKMSASVANSSGRDNNEVEIDKELGQASSAEENVPNEQESEEDASEGTSNEEEDSLGEDDGLSEGEI